MSFDLKKKFNYGIKLKFKKYFPSFTFSPNQTTTIQLYSTNKFWANFSNYFFFWRKKFKRKEIRSYGIY